MTSKCELFDHTADIGVRAFAPSLPELIEPCAAGLYTVIGDVLTVGEVRPWQFDAEGTDAALLLRDFLAELLLIFEVQRQRPVNLTVREFSSTRLTVGGRLQRVDYARSRLQREVKAVTYHELAIRGTEGQYEATFILDI
jgi:SHS2 domain-containing protein